MSTHDDPSLPLFANSFDMLSEADQYSFSDHAISPPATRGRSSHSVFTSSGHLDLSLPEFKHPPAAADSYSLGDISPIKLHYNNSGSLDDGHRLGDSFFEEHGLDSAMPPCHTTPDVVYFPDSTAGPVSNPFYVLRSVKKAFEGCKYLLPCLDGQDLCPVNITTHGPIHHYRASTVCRCSGLHCCECNPCVL